MFQHIRKNSQRGVVEVISLVLIGLTLLGSYVGTQYLSQQRLGGSSRASAPTCSSPSKSCQGNGKPWSQDSTGQYYTGFGCTGSKISYSDLVSYCGGGSSPTSTPRPAATATPRPASATYTPAPIPTASISCTGTTSCPSSCTAGCTSCTIPVGPYTRYYKCKSTSSSPTPTKSASASCTKSTEKCQQDRPWSQDSSGQYYTGNGCTGNKVSLAQLDSYCKGNSANTPTPTPVSSSQCAANGPDGSLIPKGYSCAQYNGQDQKWACCIKTGIQQCGGNVPSSINNNCGSDGSGGGGGGGGGTGPTAPPAPTAAPGSCFSLSASVDQNNYAHVTFVNGGSASGDVQLFRNGTHVAGWNGWGGGNFTYDPPNTGDALRCGEQVTFEGWARNCNPTQQYASVTGRCDAATPTPSTGRDCSPNNSCAPDVNGNRRWCGNDAKFHDEENCNHASEGCICTPPATPTQVPPSGGGGGTNPNPTTSSLPLCANGKYANESATKCYENGCKPASCDKCSAPNGTFYACFKNETTPTPTGSCAGYTLTGPQTAQCANSFETCPYDGTKYRCKNQPAGTSGSCSGYTYNAMQAIQTCGTSNYEACPSDSSKYRCKQSAGSSSPTPQTGATPTTAAAAAASSGNCPTDKTLYSSRSSIVPDICWGVNAESCKNPQGETKWYCTSILDGLFDSVPETVVTEDDPLNQYMCTYWAGQCTSVAAQQAGWLECSQTSGGKLYYEEEYQCK